MARKQNDQFGLEREEAVRKQKIRILIGAAAVLALVLAIVLLVRTRSSSNNNNPEETDSVIPVEEVEITATPTPAPQSSFAHVDLPNDPAYTEKVTIMCTGDNLIHEAIYEDAEDEEEEGYYDFRPMYELVKPDIEAADIATVNMETPLATSIAKPSGYPHFNSPRGAGYVLIDSGFDIINHANNHVMDQGVEGVYATLDYWAEHGTPVVGAYRNSSDMYDMRIFNVNGIAVAFLGIAEFTNYDIPSDSSVIVPLFSDTERIEELIKTAKENADVVVVHAHWGEEDEDVVTETMEVFAQRMVDWGADIIFGNHTHIVQDLEVLTRESDGQLCPVILSNGNFISGQKERAHLLSGLEYVTVAKNPDTGKIQIQNVQYLPVLTHYEGDRKNVKIYPLDEYTDELAASHGVVDFEGEPMTVEYLEELLQKHIPNQFRVTTKTLQLPNSVNTSGESAEEETAAEEGTSDEGESTTEEETTDEEGNAADEEDNGEDNEGEIA